MNPSLIIVGLAVLVPLAWWAAVYNKFVRLQRSVKESWADIDVELKRRYDLIPNLVETVKGYAQYERETLERVVALRNAAMANAGPAAEQARDENALQGGLRSLFAIAESYPQLKANASYLSLQQELAMTEDRIAAARRFYNGNVRDLLNLQQSFPTNLVGKTMTLETAGFFEIDDANERVVPRVNLQNVVSKG